MEKSLSKEELKIAYEYKKLLEENKILKNKLSAEMLQKKTIVTHQENTIRKEVEIRTKELTDELKNKEKIIEDRDKQIEALKMKIAKMQSIIDNDSTNSGLPTSKTPVGKKKYIPNTREKTGNHIGAQKGHPKHKLMPFSSEEINEEIEIIPIECKKCHSHNLEQLDTSIDKQELDYTVKVIKRNNKFINCKCQDCGNLFHADIPNDLKEDIQYGKTLQSLCVCLTNEIYTPFNKTVKLISGITNGEINMSEGYVTKLQKKASGKLDNFIKELKKYIPKQEVYGWDDGVIDINGKEGILRTYCTDNVALFIGHESKNEAGLDDDGILESTGEETIVMHDHILHNYNDKYKFENVECMIHLIRRLKKMKNNTNHDWNDDLIELLSSTNNDRNKILKNKDNTQENFDNDYLDKLNRRYDEIINKGKKQNEEPITKNYFKKEELNFINDLIKYKKNYLLWAYDFSLPSTNNNSERNIRPIKSKLKISGHFQNIDYAKYYATIRSYIETCKKNGINIIDACVRLLNDEPYSLKDILNLDDDLNIINTEKE